MEMSYLMFTALLVSTVVVGDVLAVQSQYDTLADPYGGSPDSAASPADLTGSAGRDDTIATEAMNPRRTAAEGFVQHVNYARVALAMKNAALATTHIANARSALISLKSIEPKDMRFTQLPSGRIMYDYDTRYKSHYFPIHTGPVEFKKLSTGPFWSPNKGIAVTDAESVYLTLDLSGETAEKHLNEAVQQIDKGDLVAADMHLESLVKEVVHEEKSTDLPLEKARDNLALARNFIVAHNYDGARYALDHVKDALDTMEQDERYAGRQARVQVMKTELAQLQQNIERQDPPPAEKAEMKIQQWWDELKD